MWPGPHIFRVLTYLLILNHRSSDGPIDMIRCNAEFQTYVLYLGGTKSAEGGQLDMCFDLIFASKKDCTVNKKVS